MTVRAASYAEHLSTRHQGHVAVAVAVLVAVTRGVGVLIDRGDCARRETTASPLGASRCVAVSGKGCQVCEGKTGFGWPA